MPLICVLRGLWREFENERNKWTLTFRAHKGATRRQHLRQFKCHELAAYQLIMSGSFLLGVVIRNCVAVKYSGIPPQGELLRILHPCGIAAAFCQKPDGIVDRNIRHQKIRSAP